MSINDKRRIRSVSVIPASAGSNEILPATADIRYNVYGFVAIAELANKITFMSDASDISAEWPLAANGGMVVGVTEVPWFSTNVGEALNVNMTQNVSTGITLLYGVDNGNA